MKQARLFRARASAALLSLAAIFASTQAAAYCRTTTCDPKFTCAQKPADCCILDSFGCDTNGVPIAWPTSCVSFNVDQEGSELRDISAEQLSSILDTAYDQWLGADCGDSGPISLALENRGQSECKSAEFNQESGDRNANIWMFLDDVEVLPGASFEHELGLDAAALGVSIVSFNPRTAEIYDVDVELISGLAPFTIEEDEDGTQIDLASVVTHEAGHFLGLDHSRVPGSTMGESYSPGTIDGRTLNQDDVAGICAVYPENRELSAENQTCEPRGEYSPKCEGAGCDCGLARSARGDVPSRGGWLAIAALSALWIRRRVRT